MPHGPRLGPVWEQSTEYLDPGPQQASDFAAPLPRGTTFYQLQAWAPSSKSGGQSARCTAACAVMDGDTQCRHGRDGPTHGSGPALRGNGRGRGTLFSQEHFTVACRIWTRGLDKRVCGMSPQPPGLPPSPRGGCGQHLLPSLARQADHE